MEIRQFHYGYEGDLPLEFDEALQRTREALARQGFGVQAEIPLSEALKAKVQADVPRELILGVCNPVLALQAMQVEPHVTVLLPCTVTVKQIPSGCRIAVANPGMLVKITENEGLWAVAKEAEQRLVAAMSEL